MQRSRRPFHLTMPIALIGFMGCGKSTVAHYFEKHYKIQVMEMDRKIEEQEGKTISEIFQQEGELYFRRLETELLGSIQKKPLIVSCGGGVAMRDENVKLLKEKGLIIYLEVSPETVYYRTKNDSSRPLLQGKKTVEDIRELMAMRVEQYRKVADIIINVDKKTIPQICRELIGEMEDTKRKNRK